jgi:hypothetical protein
VAREHGRGPHDRGDHTAKRAILRRAVPACLDTGTLIKSDRQPAAPSIADRTQLSKATTPSGRVITLQRA